MNTEQITEARQRVAAFVPHQPTKADMPATPEPFWVKQVRLNGISGPATRRLAMINNQTFEKGDELKVNVVGNSVKIRCVEVGKTSVLITIEGLEGQRELKLRQD